MDPRGPAEEGLALDQPKGLCAPIAPSARAIDAEPKPPAVVLWSQVGESDAGVHESLGDVREPLFHFRTRTSGEDIVPALRTTRQKFAHQSGLATHLNVDGDGLPLPEDVQAQVLHVVQEALSNVRKHARAREVWVEVQQSPPWRVEVRDDGRVFDAGDGRFEIVAEAGDANETHQRAATMRPDVVLLDQHMPGVSGVDALAGVKAAAPQARVPLLTVSEDERDLSAALRGGARGYLLKTMDSEIRASAILRTMAGESVVSPEMTTKLVNAFQAGPGASAPAPGDGGDPIRSLSPREREILSLIAKGASNKEVAREPGVAEATVKIHVQHILRKLNLSSRVQAAVYLAGRTG